jgi:hypothetical protein
MRPIRRALAVACVTFAAHALSSHAAMACPTEIDLTRSTIESIPADLSSDPLVRNVTAGGRVSLQNCGLNFPGYVDRNPNFLFTYSGTAPSAQFTIAVEADAGFDGILLVLTPDGSWRYSDDYRGKNPAIVFRNPVEGQYYIWAGSYDPSSGRAARLILTNMNY